MQKCTFETVDTVHDDDHDRLIRLEERLKTWMHQIENRLQTHWRAVVAIAGLLASVAAAAVIALLTSGVSPG